MKLLVIIPARGGSKRLPGKNLKPLAGKSLLVHTAEAIAASGLKAPVLLTTDDDAIAAEGERLGWEVPFRRPPALASDTASTTEAVLHALDWYVITYGSDPDAVMVLQPTSPFRGGGCLRVAVDALSERRDIESVVAMKELGLPPARLYWADSKGVAWQLADKDGRRPLYVPTGALYLTRSEALRREGSLYAGKILPLVMDEARSVDIDTLDDWRMAEALLAAGLPDGEEASFPEPSLDRPIV